MQFIEYFSESDNQNGCMSAVTIYMAESTLDLKNCEALS
jgi:hypothetical protein